MRLRIKAQHLELVSVVEAVLYEAMDSAINNFFKNRSASISHFSCQIKNSFFSLNYCLCRKDYFRQTREKKKHPWCFFFLGF
ncbi:MAG: hypothetical protein QXX55_01475 [Candidatus Pacearchaeota archaeon]